MEEETLASIRFGFSNHGLRQRRFVWPEGDMQCRTRRAQAAVASNDHKLTRIGRAGCQFIVEEPQNGLVMMRDIRSQYVYQCSHARLRQSKNTPQQAAK